MEACYWRNWLSLVMGDLLLYVASQLKNLSWRRIMILAICFIEKGCMNGTMVLLKAEWFTLRSINKTYRQTSVRWDFVFTNFLDSYVENGFSKTAEVFSWDFEKCKMHFANFRFFFLIMILAFDYHFTKKLVIPTW